MFGMGLCLVVIWCEHCGAKRELSIDNLQVRIHFVIGMIRWTGLASLAFEFPFPGSRTSAFLKTSTSHLQTKHVWPMRVRLMGGQLQNQMRTFTRKAGPESGPGCLVCAEFARQRQPSAVGICKDSPPSTASHPPAHQNKTQVGQECTSCLGVH